MQMRQWRHRVTTNIRYTSFTDQDERDKFNQTLSYFTQSGFIDFLYSVWFLSSAFYNFFILNIAVSSCLNTVEGSESVVLMSTFNKTQYSATS